MNGNFIDYYRLKLFHRQREIVDENIQFLSTSFGRIRVFDSGGTKPVLINVPDGPNIIEHQLGYLTELSKNFRTICFEMPGVGLSFPSSNYDYSFTQGADLIKEIFDSKNIGRAILAFSCSNGFYAIKFSQKYPDKVRQIFLSQTPSIDSMKKWSIKSIPKILKRPILGQIANVVYVKKLVKEWYKYSLPKESDHRDNFESLALTSIQKGGCFCLSSLTQSILTEKSSELDLMDIPTVMVWGNQDFTHRKTNFSTISKHILGCEVIEFSDCGHFPELEKTQDYVKLINEKFIK